MLRERLRPYVETHMKTASQKGTPMMRPIFYDYPDDEQCYTLGEQYLFGDDILFAPITEQGQTKKEVYLPQGRWVLTKDAQTYLGGRWYTIEAALNEFIAFVKEGAEVINCFHSDMQ